ncbi:TPA: autotransporter outer membrane beta-barrel domain-containing protein [Yersinia enterocolitica]|uniref:autotransporter outer membrane beta-barrel domain-containing protein n=1 Tax=Yersinia massiliensis TaxID=419257 RepID=UPI0028D0FC9C|nr:autotransporter outer membrane beta-barrel domain-containing protein [Yersinia massiliensis]
MHIFNKNKLALSISGIIFFTNVQTVSATVFTNVNAGANQSLVIGSGDSVIHTANAGNAVSANGINSLVTATDTVINTLGNTSNAVNALNGGMVNLNNVAINVGGLTSYGLTAENGGVVGASNITIDTSSENSAGIHGAGGTLNLDIININTSGFKSYGILSDVAGSVINLSNGVIKTAGIQSHAITLDAGIVNLASTTVETYADLARGVNINNGAEVIANDINIITHGNDRADGVSVAGKFTGFNINILTEGINTYAVTLRELGDLSISNSQLSSKSAAINFTAQATRTGATAEFLNSTIIAEDNVIVSGNSIGQVSLINTVTHSASNKFASAGNNSIIDITARDKSVISGGLIADLTSNISLSLENDSQWSGYSQNAAKISLDSSSSWILTGNSDVNNLVNAGVISLNGAPGTTLMVTGDYIGDNGLLNFNTVLNDDTSATDKLVVNGNTSGTSFVSVNNVGGIGMATLNGIELIQVNGMSDGDFVKNGRIVAGAYEYSLVRGTGVNTNNWYLTNELVSNPAPDLPPSVPVQRPEAGAYTANLAAANNMFVTRLHDRLGETQYIDALTGEQKVTSMWLRNEGGHNRSRDINGQLNTQANRYVVQLGGDIAQWSNNGMDRFHLGVMAGYGNSKSTTVSQETGYNAKGSIDGYSTGVYGTWYANEVDKSGLYVDGWMQYSWFNNTVDGQALATEEYKSKGISTSIESGYTFKMGENVAKNATYFIQPKAQVTWMGVKSDDHKEANGTIVSGEGDGNIQTRLGVKAFMNGYSDQDKGKERVFQPFVEANWVHNTKDIGTTLNNVTVSQDGAANIGELKVGVEGQINRKVNLWGNVGQQIGNKGYSDTAVMLGVKYNF